MMSPTEYKKESSAVLQHAGWEEFLLPKNSNINYAVTGHESQVVTLELPEGETCQAEPGTMMYLTSGIVQSASCEGFCGRCCAGEDCCATSFTNSGAGASGKGYVGLSPNYPTAKVVPVDLSSPEVGGTLICQQGAWMASYGTVKIGVSVDMRCGVCCCGGFGLVRQKLEGDGIAFLEGTGTMVQKVLKEGETIVGDSNCFMAFADSCKLDIRRTGGIVGMMGGGEGIFNTVLTGPGLVIMQSMNQQTFETAMTKDKIWSR